MGVGVLCLERPLSKLCFADGNWFIDLVDRDVAAEAAFGGHELFEFARVHRPAILVEGPLKVLYLAFEVVVVGLQDCLDQTVCVEAVSAWKDKEFTGLQHLVTLVTGSAGL